MPPDHCPEHSGNCVRIDSLEKRMNEVESKVGSPAVMVALVSLFGVCFTAATSFLAVVFAPIIRAYLGVG